MCWQKTAEELEKEFVQDQLRGGFYGGHTKAVVSMRVCVCVCVEKVLIQMTAGTAIFHCSIPP